jgi:hypothetical protein
VSDEELIRLNARNFVEALRAGGREKDELRFWESRGAFRLVFVEMTAPPTRAKPILSQAFASQMARLEDFEAAVRELLNQG